jgi:hypothetical protein
MSTEQKLTLEDARLSLTSHASEKGAQLHSKYGPHIGWTELRQVMEDRSLVRYPCEIVFSASGLRPGEMAHPFPNAEDPSEGFKLHVHPLFMTQLERAVAIVLYQLVLVNYGEFAAAEDAEAFGAAALGISAQDYYLLLCESADQLGGASC